VKIEKHITLLFFVIMLLMACGGHQYESKLIAADSLAETAPDSAMHYLQRISTYIPNMPDSEQAYYKLLCVKSADKAYMPLPNDSVILSVVNFFERIHNYNLLPVAYYYAGRTFFKQNAASRALSYYQKAMDVVDRSNKKAFVKDKILCNMGLIFFSQSLYDEAIDKYKESFAVEKEYGKYRDQIFNLRDIALCYSRKNDKEKAKHYYLAALALARKINSKDMIADISSQIARFYADMGIYKVAKKYIQTALNYNDADDRKATLSISADIYKGLGMSDSAFIMYKEIEKINDVYAKQFAYKRLSEYYISRHDAANAYIYTRLNEKYLDSLQNISATKEVARMNSVYNNKIKNKEIANLKEKMISNKFLLFVVIFMSFLVLFVFVFMTLHSQKRNKEKGNNEDFKKTSETEYCEDVNDAFDKTVQNEETEDAAVETIDDDDDTEVDTERHRKKLRNLIELANINKEERAAAQIKLKDSIVCKRILMILHSNSDADKMTPDDWKELENTILFFFPDFKNNLLELCKLSETNFRISLLLKIEIPVNEIAKLIFKKSNSVTSARKRLYEKIFGHADGPEAFDKLIHLL
jgi:tetratricopeptide (TPR) repeat protein